MPAGLFGISRILDRTALDRLNHIYTGQRRVLVRSLTSIVGSMAVAEDLAQEQAILRAMIYIESFEDYFQGSRVSALQELSWPRAYVPNKLGTAYLASDAIPNGVKNALSEAAIAELASPGVLTATVSHSNANVKRKRDKIGPLETEVEYFGGVSLDAKTYTRILEFLRPYFRTAKSAYSVRGH